MKTPITFTRRELLRRGRYIPLAAVAIPVLTACEQTGTIACADPALLSRGEEQMRKTLKYIENATDKSQICRDCEFFGAANTTSCGHCELLNGAVHAQGYCTSWAAS